MTPHTDPIEESKALPAMPMIRPPAIAPHGLAHPAEYSRRKHQEQGSNPEFGCMLVSMPAKNASVAFGDEAPSPGPAHHPFRIKSSATAAGSGSSETARTWRGRAFSARQEQMQRDGDHEGQQNDLAYSTESRNVSNKTSGHAHAGMNTAFPELQNNCASDRKIRATPKDEITV